MRSDLTFSGALNISAIIIANTPLAQVSIDSAQLGTGENPQIKIQGSTNVVYPEAFAHGYTLGSSAAAFQARATIDGISMFTNVGPGTYSVSFPQIGIAFDAYLVALAFIFGLISLTIFGRFPERLLRNMRALKLRIKESREPAKDPSEG